MLARSPARSGPAPAATHDPRATAPAVDARGNAAAAADLAVSDGQGESEVATSHLGYKVDKAEDGTSRDPEQRDGVLPFDAKGDWDANAILSALTQVDDDGATQVDGMRCAAVSTLAAHILAGPMKIVAVAASVLPQAILRAAKPDEYGFQPEVAKALQSMIPTLAGLPGKIVKKTATYQDLRRLSDCMKLCVDPDPTSGTSAKEYADLMAIGGGTASFVGANKKGWSDAKDFADALKKEGAQATYVLSVGTADNKPDVTNHAVNMGLDRSGQLFLYDPWPREGKQMLSWSSDQALIKPYFENTEGIDRVWRVRTRMPATTS